MFENGTTSACAENTPRHCAEDTEGRNYLRVRGEYPTCQARVIIITELPPRARRIRPMDSVTSGAIGTTSACAENTHCDMGFCLF